MTETRDGKYGILDEVESPRSGISPEAAAPVERVVLLSSGDTVFRLNKERIVLGAVVSADVRLVGDDISPIHAVLEVAGDGSPTIFDLASETGLQVNGKKVVTSTLKSGDQITLGRHTLSFSIGEIPKTMAKERVRESGGKRLLMNPNEDFSPLLLESEGETREIFDYRPTQKRALEVVMSWKGTILDVEHFVKEKTVTIGTARDNDFGIPPILSSSRFAVVTRAGEGFVLNLEDEMKGVIHRQGKLEGFEALRGGRSGGFQVTIGNEDFAKVTIGDVDFYMSFTAAPPRLKTSKLFDRDPLFLKIFSASMVLTVVTINLLLNARIPQALEAEQIPERIATILYQPEKYGRKVVLDKDTTAIPANPVSQPKNPVPTPTRTIKVDITPNPNNANRKVPKELVVTGPKTAQTGASKTPKRSRGQKQAKEGKGAKAKGKEGTRGQPKAVADKQHQDKANRPSPQGGSGAGGGDSRVANIGNVDMLNSATARITNILGSTAEKLGKGGEKLKGFGGFTTQGGGGLALSGSGKGGGGTADSLGGLADKGTGGGKIGTGKGATGTGTGIIGGKARVAIRSGGPEEAVVMGTIDADAVEAALLAHRDEFRLCYEKEINAEHPSLAGRVSTNFVIGSTGRVNQAGIESTSLKNPPIERCILTVIRRIDFPIPRGAGLVQVTYPFKFSPTK